MIEHPAVRKINFTGSTAVGRKIARACGQNLKPCLMELGGKNSSIVCADADLNTAVQGVLAGAFLNVSFPYPMVLKYKLSNCSISPAKSAWQPTESSSTPPSHRPSSKP